MFRNLALYKKSEFETIMLNSCQCIKSGKKSLQMMKLLHFSNYLRALRNSSHQSNETRFWKSGGRLECA
ncbi:MAG: hypothetical protein CMI24_01205 [Opitutae bacterium]|nr:hypothetical protein [Opitutae bacterium]